VTRAEVQAMSARVNARELRRNAGFSLVTVGRAFGVPPDQIARWESGRYLPCCPAGFRWLKFAAALERRAAFRAGEATAGLARAA
jgi:transcriptional regulator with XRE-family HTH domain